jgi:hypothetical protein
VNSKYGNLFMMFFKTFFYCLFIEVIFKGSCFELEKSIFEVKHTYTF